MTKEEQRFTAAVAAMNGLLANNSSIFNTGGGDSIDCDNLASTSIAYADTLIKKLDNKVDNKEILLILLAWVFAILIAWMILAKIKFFIR